MSDGTYPLDTIELDAEEIGNLRLLDAARITRERKRPEKFTMAFWAHECGTPGCVLGEYAASGAAPGLELDGIVLLAWGECSAESPFDWAEDWFSLTWPEADALFGENGCGDAQSPAEAADFVEAFVAKRRAARGK